MKKRTIEQMKCFIVLFFDYYYAYAEILCSKRSKDSFVSIVKNK